MESGWMYLGPDSDSDQDGDAGHVVLPDGRMACSRHLRIICNQCMLDFSEVDPVEVEDDDDDLVDDDDDDDDDDDVGNDGGGNDGGGNHILLLPPRSSLESIPQRDINPERHHVPGLVFPTKFTPPHQTSTPTTLFTPRATNFGAPRFTLHQDPRTFLIYTDGACLHNGQAHPRAGWALVHAPPAHSVCGPVSGRLENKGPTGVPAPQTSNRAEMRAVLALFVLRYWPGEGCATLVIATDSEYVVEGATERLRRWVQNGWRTRAGEAVKNRDLWDALLGHVKKMAEGGMKVQFWRIPREWNTVADAAAKEAAEKDEVEEYTDIHGIYI